MPSKVEDRVQFQMSPLAQFMATIALSLATFLFVLDYTVVNVAIPYIAGGLATSVDQGIYTITFFAVGNAVVLPMTGWFSKRFGVVKTIVASSALFTLFSWFCSTADSIFMLVLFRFLQGAAAGPLVPLSQGILTMIYPKSKITTVMAIYSLVVLVGPVVGPVLGGYFCVTMTWRWAFYINIPIGIFCTILMWVLLKKMDRVNPEDKFDWLSCLLLLAGMTGLQLFLDKGQQWDWFRSDRIWICVVVAVVCLTYLILWNLVASKPLIKLQLLRNRVFAVATIAILLVYSFYIGTVVLIPLWLQTYQNYDAYWAGVAVAPIGIFPVLGSYFVGKWVKKIGFLVPLILGFFIMSMASLYTRYFTSGLDLFHIALSRFFLGVGVTFWIVPHLTMPATALSSEELPDGLSIFHTVRAVSGGIGASVYTTIFNRRVIHQHNNLISNFNEYNPASASYMQQINDLGITGESGLTVANNLLDQQAAALALNEVNLLIAWVGIALCFLILLSIKKKGKEPVKSKARG